MTNRVFIVAGALVAVLLQVFLAPHIGIGYAAANFLVVFTMVVAVARGASFGAVFPFIMGLVFDLTSGGPVGVMAFSLTAFSMLASRLSERLGNDTLFMGYAVMALGFLLVELSYGVFLLLFGYNAGIVEAFAYRALPCLVYDIVLGLIVYPLAVRYLRPESSSLISVTQLR